MNTTFPQGVKAVLFDMDGVLYDSMKNHAHAWTQVFRSINVEIPHTLPYLCEGRTGEGFIRYVFNDILGQSCTHEQVQQLYKLKCQLFNQCPKATIMPGALETLQAVAQHNWTSGIVTGSGQASLLDKIQTNFPDTFQPCHMVTAHDVRHGKPSPEPYLMGLRKLGVAPHQAIVIENAPMGVESAVAAGIYTIAVNTGPLPSEVLLEAGASQIFDTMHALAHYLTSQQ